MHTTKLRKVGGSIMLSVPPAILDLLNLHAGSTVDIRVDGNKLVIEGRSRPSYSLAELLACSDYSKPQPAEEREWFAQKIGFAVSITGIKTTGVVRCDQPRVLDIKARQERRVDRLPPEILEEVMARLLPIVE
jgi:antitoxin ChpS